MNWQRYEPPIPPSEQYDGWGTHPPSTDETAPASAVDPSSQQQQRQLPVVAGNDNPVWFWIVEFGREFCSRFMRTFWFMHNEYITVKDLDKWLQAAHESEETRKDDLQHDEHTFGVNASETHTVPSYSSTESSSEPLLPQRSHQGRPNEDVFIHTSPQLRERIMNSDSPPKHPIPDRFIIIDTRRNDEYEFSHLKGSINIHTDFAWMHPCRSRQDREKIKQAERALLSSNRIPNQLENVPLDTAIICYCAIGLRSGLFTRKLKQLGFTNVYTLEGSFYKWVNMGKPLYSRRRLYCDCDHCSRSSSSSSSSSSCQRVPSDNALDGYGTMVSNVILQRQGQPQTRNTSTHHHHHHHISSRGEVRLEPPYDLVKPQHLFASLAVSRKRLWTKKLDRKLKEKALDSSSSS